MLQRIVLLHREEPRQTATCARRSTGNGERPPAPRASHARRSLITLCRRGRKRIVVQVQRDFATTPTERPPSSTISATAPSESPRHVCFIRWSLSMLARLIDHRCRQQLRGIEVAYGESLEPCFLPTRQAVKLCAPDVPQLDVDAIGAALAEEEHGHRASLAAKRTKGKTWPARRDFGSRARRRPRERPDAGSLHRVAVSRQITFWVWHTQNRYPQTGNHTGKLGIPKRRRDLSMALAVKHQLGRPVAI